MHNPWPRKTLPASKREDSSDSRATGPFSGYKGWRFGVLAWTISTCLVLAMNISLATWAIARHGWGRKGQPILYEGKCDMVSKLSTVAHLLINAMSTALLCASTYCMQCLSAPTRKELDRAHARQLWLDIGVLSPRNLKAISKSRRVRWLILGLSTIPLHLFYNSVIFASSGANLYFPFLVKESFLTEEPAYNPSERTLFKYTPNENSSFYEVSNGQSPDALAYSETNIPETEARRMRDLYHQEGLERLENHDCLKAYVTQFQVRGNLLLVSKDNNPRDSNFLSALGGPWSRQDWICGSNNCDEGSGVAKQLWEHPEKWEYSNYNVAYCLSERPTERCRLQCSLPLMVVVVLFNIAKVICMFSMLYALDSREESSPIMSIGDAIASYLTRSDDYTKGMCLATMDDIRRAMAMSQRWDTRPKEYKGLHRRRFRAASRTRWGVCCVLYIAILSFTSWLLRKGTSTATANGGVTGYDLIMSLGFGKINNRTTLQIRLTDLITNAVIANTPQVILSWTYFSYNGLLTLMSLATEWESYTLQRKGLRVSCAPKGEQRSTYFLQLPYRIAVPVSILSAFLHWLVSQSFFLVSVQLYGHDKTMGWQFLPDNPGTRVSCGYSLLPVLILLGSGSVLVVVIIVRGLIPLRSATPIIGSCSAAIAAACQPLDEDDGEASTEKVEWGVMGRKQKFKHCGISRRHVNPPVQETLYR